MRIFGKELAEYIAFARVWIIVVLAVGLTRLALSLAGLPNESTKWISMTAVMWIGLVYYSVRVHTSGFGTYRHLLPVVAVTNLAFQAVSIIGIVIAIFTGNPNVFTAPEYAFGGDGKTWFHAGAHLLIGTTAGSLVPWLFGCLIMFVSTKLSPRGKHTGAAAQA